MLTKNGADILLGYGDPAYYGQFGFKEKIGRLFVLHTHCNIHLIGQV